MGEVLNEIGFNTRGGRGGATTTKVVLLVLLLYFVSFWVRNLVLYTIRPCSPSTRKLRSALRPLPTKLIFVLQESFIITKGGMPRRYLWPRLTIDGRRRRRSMYRYGIPVELRLYRFIRGLLEIETSCNENRSTK